MLTVLFSVRDCFRARAVLQAEILALRHQLLVLQRSSRTRRLRLRWADRVLVGLAFAIVERLALGTAPCRDCHRLASQGVSTVLESEESSS